MSSDTKCLVSGWTGHFGHHCPDSQCYGYDEFGHFAQDCPYKIPPSEHHATTEDVIHGIDTPTTGGTDDTPIMVCDIGDINEIRFPPMFKP